MVSRIPNASFWAGKRVLITGHTGFKGSWLVQWLSSMDAEVYGISLAPSGQNNLFDLARLDELCTHDVMDLRAANQVQSAVVNAQPDIIFHMAAQSLVRPSIADPQETYSTNVMGTVNLLEAARKTQSVGVVLCVTSDKVYRNDNSGTAFSENAPLGGKDPYSASKAAQEIVVQSYCQSFFERSQSRLASVRGGNVIGGGDFSVDRIIPDVVRSIESGEPLVLRHPEATRPWQHVLDCLNGYILFAEHLADTKSSITTLNIGPDADQEFATVQMLIDKLFRVMNRDPNWKHEAVEGSLEAKMLSLNNQAAKDVLGWQDRLTGNSMIDMTAQWYKSYFNNEDMRAVTAQQIQNFCN